jgi:hypothetical protein
MCAVPGVLWSGLVRLTGYARRATYCLHPPRIAVPARAVRTDGRQMADEQFRLLSSGIDSLYFSARGALDAGFLALLKGLRGSNGTSDAVMGAFPSDDLSFLLKGPLRGYPYWLRAPGYDLMVGHTEPAAPLIAELRSWYLHSEGAETAGEHLRTRLEADMFDGAFELKTSRIDVYADFQGWTPHHLDFQRFVCRARFKELHQPDGELHGFGNEVSGFTFGRGAVRARIYNKTLEQAVHRDTGASLLWGDFDRDQAVWRLEFQFRRQALMQLGAAGGLEVLAARQGLWHYGTTEWLSLRERSAHSKPSRWPEDPLWSWLRFVEVGSPCNPLIRARIRKADFSRVVSGLVGYLSSLGALTGTYDLGQVMPSARVHAERYIQERGVPFPRLVKMKVDRNTALWGNGSQ